MSRSSLITPSRKFATTNFQPTSTHSTMPSSMTRLVVAIMKAVALAGWAPLVSTVRVAAREANEQDDEIKPKKPDSAAGLTPRSPRSPAICSRVTRTWIAAEII